MGNVAGAALRTLPSARQLLGLDDLRGSLRGRQRGQGVHRAALVQEDGVRVQVHREADVAVPQTKFFGSRRVMF